MATHLLTIISIFLLLASPTLYAQPPQKNPQQEINQWHKKSQRLFDQFLGDDDFFDDSSLMDEMAKVRNQLVRELQGASNGTFDSRFEDFFQNHYGSSAQQFYTEDLGTHIKLHLSIPGLDQSNMRIQIKENAVVIDGDVTKKETRTDFAGNVIGESLYTSKIHQSIPLPSGVRPEDVQFEKGEDKVVLIIPKMGSEKMDPIMPKSPSPKPDPKKSDVSKNKIETL